MIRSFLLTALALTLTGCALINALAGSGDEPACAGSCPPLTCVTPLSLGLGVNEVDVCDQLPGPPFPSCGSPFGEEAVVLMNLEGPGDYQVCLTDGISGTLLVGDTCDTSQMAIDCVPQGSCTSMFLGGPAAFLTFRTDEPGACGKVRFEMIPIGKPEPLESGAACLDGIDNDGNGSTDCSDFQCMGDPAGMGFEPVCEAGFGIERCDGLDDGSVGGPFPPGTVDEMACRCVNDAGCANLSTTAGSPFICHDVLAAGGEKGVCNPSCLENDWCQLVGGGCGADGRCVQMVPANTLDASTVGPVNAGLPAGSLLHRPVLRSAP